VSGRDTRTGKGSKDNKANVSKGSSSTMAHGEDWGCNAVNSNDLAERIQWCMHNKISTQLHAAAMLTSRRLRRIALYF
jgi:hypothetical protein